MQIIHLLIHLKMKIHSRQINFKKHGGVMAKKNVIIIGAAGT